MEEFLKSALTDLGLTEEEAELEVSDFIDTTSRSNGLEEFYVGCAGFAQVGKSDYYDKQRFEAKFLKNYIKKELKDPPNSSFLKWKPNNHDFGMYYDMAFMANPDNKSHMNYLNKLESIDFDGLEPLIRQAYIQATADERMFTDEEIDEDNEIFKLID